MRNATGSNWSRATGHKWRQMPIAVGGEAISQRAQFAAPSFNDVEKMQNNHASLNLMMV